MRVRDLKDILNEVDDDLFIILTPTKDISNNEMTLDMFRTVSDIGNIFGFNTPSEPKYNCLVMMYSEPYDCIELQKEHSFAKQ